jgi:hypothetical protein
VARALGSTVVLLVAGSHVGFTGRGFWSVALGSIQWAVGRVCVVRVLMVKDICWKGICGCYSHRKNPRYWIQDGILKKKTVLRTKILQTLIVQQHCSENFVEFGCQGIVQ